MKAEAKFTVNIKELEAMGFNVRLDRDGNLSITGPTEEGVSGMTQGLKEYFVESGRMTPLNAAELATNPRLDGVRVIIPINRT